MLAEIALRPEVEVEKVLRLERELGPRLSANTVERERREAVSLSILRCPACHGLLRREPATVVCTACGRRGEVLDASDQDRRHQGALDLALRPRSAECSGEEVLLASAARKVILAH